MSSSFFTTMKSCILKKAKGCYSYRNCMPNRKTETISVRKITVSLVHRTEVSRGYKRLWSTGNLLTKRLCFRKDVARYYSSSQLQSTTDSIMDIDVRLLSVSTL
ncbi:uncharacterized protein WM294_003129 [Sarcoramphus papa]